LISDAASLRLVHAGVPVDVVCYFFDPTTLMELTTKGYMCAGTPVFNPHDNTTSTDVDTSIARKPGGVAGNCTDTGDNAADFTLMSPSTPADTASPPTP
jgi:hypothetical protein